MIMGGYKDVQVIKGKQEKERSAIFSENISFSINFHSNTESVKAKG
jgi:hypothetical protein